MMAGMGITVADVGRTSSSIAAAANSAGVTLRVPGRSSLNDTKEILGQRLNVCTIVLASGASKALHRKQLVTESSSGFGSKSKTAKYASVKKNTKKRGMPTLEEALGSQKETKQAASACPCGGGEEKKGYVDCCARYHGGVKEPDAVTLMRARYSAFARGVVPYLVRTTHPDNPNLAGPDAKQRLEDDCKTTCERLVFKRLDILETEGGEADEEAYVSFKAVYAYKQGTTNENQTLIEKSRFTKDGDRWFYRAKVDIDHASQVSWKYGAALANGSEEKAVSQPKFKLFGRAQAKIVGNKGQE